MEYFCIGNIAFHVIDPSKGQANGKEEDAVTTQHALFFILYFSTEQTWFETLMRKEKIA